MARSYLFWKQRFVLGMGLVLLGVSLGLFPGEGERMTQKKSMFWIGIDGATNTHKSEIWRLLSSFLEKRFFPILMTEDPKGTELSKKINALVCDLCGEHLTEIHQSPFSWKSEFLLYLAASVEVKKRVIDKNRKNIIVSKGTPYASLVYQLGHQLNKWEDFFPYYEAFLKELPDILIICQAKNYEDALKIREQFHPNAFEKFSLETFQEYKKRWQSLVDFLKKKGKYVIQLETSTQDDLSFIVENVIFPRIISLLSEKGHPICYCNGT